MNPKCVAWKKTIFFKKSSNYITLLHDISCRYAGQRYQDWCMCRLKSSYFNRLTDLHLIIPRVIVI